MVIINAEYDPNAPLSHYKKMRTLCSLVPREARADVHVDGKRIAEANRSKQHFCNSKRIRKTAKFNRVTVKVKNKTSIFSSVEARLLKVIFFGFVNSKQNRQWYKN